MGLVVNGAIHDKSRVAGGYGDAFEWSRDFRRNVSFYRNKCNVKVTDNLKKL